MSKKKNRKAKRLRTKGPGRPVKMTRSPIKKVFRALAVALLTVLALVAIAVLGDLVMLVNVTNPILVAVLTALDAGLKVVDFVAKVVGIAAFIRAVRK